MRKFLDCHKLPVRFRRLFPDVPLIALAICFACPLLGQTASARTVKGDPPTVTMNAKGCPVLTLSAPQAKAVQVFLQVHPNLERYDYSPAQYEDGSCLDTYQQWTMSGGKAANNYPFAVWGDFNHDGQLDLVLFFKGKRPAVTHDWPMNGQVAHTYEYDWWVVVFQGTRDGGYSPVIAARDRWGDFLDGVIFQPTRHRIEYWVKTAGGSVQWTPSGYKQAKMTSSD